MNDQQREACGWSPPPDLLPLAGREDRRTGLSVDALKRALLDKLVYVQARFPAVATRRDCFHALAQAVRDRLLQRWVQTARTSVSYTHLDVYKRQAQLFQVSVLRLHPQLLILQIIQFRILFLMVQVLLVLQEALRQILQQEVPLYLQFQETLFLMLHQTQHWEL